MEKRSICIILCAITLFGSASALGDTWHGKVDPLFNKTIPDNGGYYNRELLQINVTDVPSNAKIKNVRYYCKVNHSYRGDLCVDLTAYINNSWVSHRISDREGSSADNVYKDETFTSFNGGCVSPDNPNPSSRAVSNYNPNGQWYLVAWDNATGDEGNLDSLELWIEWEVPIIPGEIKVTLKNWNGNNSAASKTKFILYPGTVAKTGSNPATYTGLAPRSSSDPYWVEGYQYGPFNEWEYWGSVSATVSAGQTTTKTINRHTPYCEDFWFEYNGSRVNSTDHIPPGATVTPKALIRNKDTSSRSVYATMGWRLGTSGSAVGTKQSSTVTVNANSTVTLSFPTVTFTANTEGDIYAYIKTYGMFSGWALTDTWDWTKMVSVKWGSIQATLKNWNGNNSTASLTKFILYPGTVAKTGSNPVSYTGLAPRTASDPYWVEGYQNGAFNEYEYWGSVSAAVSAGQTTPVTINRHTPYCEDFWFEYNGNRVTPSGYIPSGATVTPKALIRNKDTSSRSVYATIGWRLGTSGSAVGTKQSSTVTVNANSTVTLSFPTVTFTANTEGDIYAYIKTYGMFSGWALTDTWDWTKMVEISCARITAFTVPTGTCQPGTRQKITVNFMNIGPVARKFWVGLSFEGPNAEYWPGRGWTDVPPKQVPPADYPDLAPGGTASVTFDFVLPEWLPEGSYIAHTAIWKDFNDAMNNVTTPDGKEYTVAGLMVDELAREQKTSFVIVPFSTSDRYGLAGFDPPGGLYANIPQRHSNANLLELPENRVSPLRDTNLSPLSASTQNVVVLFHGWRSGDTYQSGEFLTLKNNLPSVLPSNWKLVPYCWGQDSETGFWLYRDRDATNNAMAQIQEESEVVTVTMSENGQEVKSAAVVTTVILALAYVSIEAGEQNIAANSTVAAYRAYMHGLVLGERLCTNVGIGNLKKVHIISHSAGSWGAYATMRYLRYFAPDVEIQVTYLDPFIPSNILSNVQELMSFVGIWDGGSAFSSAVLDSTKNDSWVYTPNAFSADCYYSFSDGTYWGAVLLENVQDVIGKSFSPIVSMVEGAISPKLRDSTKINWSWSGTSNITYRTDPTVPHIYDGHGGPVKYYADSILDPSGLDFTNKAWQRSLAANSMQQYNLIANFRGQGSMSLNPPGGVYDSGTQVQVTADPSPGWHFVQWEGDLSGSANPAIITMNSNKSVTAIFEQDIPDQYILLVNTQGQGSISLNPSGGVYDSGTQVEIIADAHPGWQFVRWEGDLSHSANPAIITMNSNKNVTAIFEQDIPNQYILLVDTQGQGSVSLNPPGGVYDSGTQVQVTADPSPGWQFARWEGDLTGSANPEFLTLNSNKEITAIFEENSIAFEGFTVINKTRISRTVYQYDLAISLWNLGSFDLTDISVVLINADEQVISSIDDNVEFPSIPAGTIVSSHSFGDYFTIQVDRSDTIDPANLTWEIIYPIENVYAVKTISSYLEDASSLRSGDITGEGAVNLDDLLVLAEQWLGVPGTPSADIAPFPDGDGKVDLLDFALLAEHWMQ